MIAAPIVSRRTCAVQAIGEQNPAYSPAFFRNRSRFFSCVFRLA